MPAAEVSQDSTPVPEAESLVAAAAAAATADEPAQRLKQSRKRKRPNAQTAAAAAASATASKASPGVGDTGSPGPDGAAVVQLTSGSSRFDPSKPIPACAPPPNMVPVPSLPGFFATQEMAVNRKYRYTDAVEVAPFVFHSQQSPPADCVRVAWEDRSPHIRVTQDGLGLAGDRGYRSARLNVPVREGKWYLEVLVERGGGADKGELSGHTDGAHIRLGWARREAPLEAPVGCDGYSYGFCDKTGHKTTLSRPKPYGRPFGNDDVIGMYISLPPQRKPKPDDPHDPAHIRRKRQAVLLKNRLYFEQAEYPQSKEMMALMESGASAATAKRGPQARPHGADDENAPGPQHSPSKRSATVKNLPGSGGGPRSKKTPAPEPQGRSLPTLGKEARIAFFVNGVCQGTAFEDIYDYLQLRLTSAMRKAREKEKKDPLKERENAFDDGSLGYYAMISLFNSGRVQINPGPDFKFPPPPDVDAVLDAMDAGADPSSVSQEDVKRTWRPLSERYPEYWEEVKAQDLVDDDPEKAAAKTLEDEEKSQADAKAKADEEKKALQREKRRIRDAARRRANKERENQMVHGGSKLATASTPADDKMDTGSEAAPTPTPAPPQPPNQPQPVPAPAPAPPPAHAVMPPEALRYAPYHRRPSTSQSPQAIKREFPPPPPQLQYQYQPPYAVPAPLPQHHQHYQPFQFAPPYQYPIASASVSARPSTSPTVPMQRPSTGSVSTLMHAFDSPPRRAAELPPAPPQPQPQPPQRTGMFDPVRDEYQPRPVSGGGVGVGGNSLQIDTGPSGFHPQWERDERPASSPSLGAPFRYTAGPGMAGGYGPPPPPPQSYQRHSLSPVVQQRAYGPISPRPALFSYGSGPIGAPTSPVAYVMQAESSLRSGAAAADEDDEDDRGGDDAPRPASASASAAQRVWDHYPSGRDRDGDVTMRDGR